VSSDLAKRLWPGSNPIGKHLLVDDEHEVEIIAVAPEQRVTASPATAQGLLYLPMSPGTIHSTLVLHMRVNGSTDALVASIRRALQSYNKNVVPTEVVSMDGYIRRALMPQRAAAQVAGVLALLQLALAITGLSGLVAYVTTQRRREIGIRSALGARRADILSLVLRQGIRLTFLGGVVGAILSIVVGKVVAESLPATMTAQLGSAAAAVLCFTLVAISAMLWFARRALAFAPAAALRLD
jgi:putative ABC transport system permease protein